MIGHALRKLIQKPIVYPPAPAGCVLYAVGDIHGRVDLLERVFDRIDRDYETVKEQGRRIEVYVGDYVDRGPQSERVVSALLDRSARVETVFLRGNHEQALLSFLAGFSEIGDWAQIGGLPTIQSYGVDPKLTSANIRDALWEKMPNAHRSFYARTHSYVQFGGYLFVHAGIRPGIELTSQSSDDLLWIRDDFLSHSGNFGAIIVHGHTPVREPEFLRNRVNIDTGAFITNKLTCIRIDAEGAIEIQR